MFGRAGKVEYFPKLPAFPLHKAGIENMTETVFLSKAKCWDYEREYRIIAAVANRLLPKNIVLPIVEDDKIPLPNGSLLSVILGCEMNADDRTKIRAIASHHRVPVKEVRRRKNRYELELLA
jgi:hypothetical protein